MTDSPPTNFPESKPNKLSVPRHLAAIMDGNYRWAKKTGSTPVEAYMKGSDALQRAIESVIEYHIPYFTVYAFSTENWNRSEDEIVNLMDLFRSVILSKEAFFHKHEVRFRVIGSALLDDRYADLTQSMERLAASTKGYDKLTLTIALNYGSKQEIVHATQNICAEVVSGNLSEEELTVEMFEKYLYTKHLPPVDLLIRTSGEYRLSNFLLWQVAYAELFFTKTLWPDFCREDFEEALREYSGRNRRFGTSHLS